MSATDAIGTTLPDGIDEDSYNNENRRLIVDALAKEFRESVKSKGTSVNLDKIIAGMTVEDINDLIFDYPIPNIPDRNYYSIIDEFLSDPDAYKGQIKHMADGYLSILSELQKRVQTLLLEGKTSEDDRVNRTSTASYLDTRLSAICERTKLVIYVNRVNRDVTDLNKQLTDITSNVSEGGELYLKINNLEETVKGVNDTSDKIMPNLVTLLGVFSSVIVVILSLITTSSTWLLNANETSVLIAFVVPAAIATLAVCALTAFIRPLIDNVSRAGETQSQDKVSLGSVIGKVFRKWGLWFSVAAIALLVVFGTMWFCQKEEDNQNHYIVKCVPMSETIDHSNGATVQPSSETSSPELFIIYEVILPTGEIYPEKIPCGESDKHEDGYVYYCLLHERFE